MLASKPVPYVVAARLLQVEMRSNADIVSRMSRAAAAATLATAAMVSAAAAEGWPSHVHATYDITFNGFKVGSFDFNSSTDAGSYSLSGGGKVSVMLGALKWAANGSASGQLGSAEARPKSFSFDMKGTSRAGTTSIAFAGGSVSNVVMVPPPKVKDDTIPLQPQHLVGAFDPLSAVVMLTRGGPNPCGRHIPVFEGQRRIDISLTQQGTVPLEIKETGGHPTTGVVCRLNYKFIAGHRAGDEHSYMTRNQHIELILRPVPEANVYVPYRLSATTLLGYVRVQVRDVTIQKSGRKDIVLAH